MLCCANAWHFAGSNVNSTKHQYHIVCSKLAPRTTSVFAELSSYRGAYNYLYVAGVAFVPDWYALALFMESLTAKTVRARASSNAFSARLAYIGTPQSML